MRGFPTFHSSTNFFLSLQKYKLTVFFYFLTFSEENVFQSIFFFLKVCNLQKQKNTPQENSILNKEDSLVKMDELFMKLKNYGKLKHFKNSKIYFCINFTNKKFIKKQLFRKKTGDRKK